MTGRSHPRGIQLFYALLVIVAGVAVTAFIRSGLRHDPQTASSPKPPPPAVFDDFVGQDACIQCHESIVDRFVTTGHSRTFTHTRESEIAAALHNVEFHDTERDVDFHYHFDSREGLSVSIPGRFGEDRFSLPYAVGSNMHAQTFLTLVPDPFGELSGIEHRISVYGEDGRLGLTPDHRGERPSEGIEMFGSVRSPHTVEMCVGCHTTFFEVENLDLKNVLPNVQCESCHGPGKQHVENMSQGREEMMIDALRADNPASILSQIERCGDCHRHPSDFDQADIEPDNRQLVRFQPVGLMNCDCFLKSNGMLSCTTCHDPHSRPREQREAALRACMSCHDSQQPSAVHCPISSVEGCIECHMPSIEVHEGISFRNHWIRVHDESTDEDPRPADGVPMNPRSDVRETGRDGANPA